jgi:hypothetical protein
VNMDEADDALRRGALGACDTVIETVYLPDVIGVRALPPRLQQTLSHDQSLYP